MGVLDGMKAVWDEAVADATRSVAYLRFRGLPEEALDQVADDALRFHPALPYWDYDEAGDPVHVGDLPAMVARVDDENGCMVTLHRTYLDPTGPGKAPVGAPKKLMKTAQPGATNGAAVRLFSAGSTLGLTEGIETALAVHAATGLPAWPCVSASGMERVILPDAVRTVHIWADNDDSGRGLQAAQVAAKRFHAEGRGVFLHMPPRVGEDWLDVFAECGASVLLDELTESLPWVPGQCTDDARAREIGVLLSTVEPEEVEWLWEGRIPLGKLTVLDGDPGLGKSTVSLDIAARVSIGGPMPDGTRGVEPAGVVLLSAEDGLADTIVPRLVAAGADLACTLALPSCPDREGDGEHPPVLEDDLSHILEAITRVSARLVVIDPLMAYLSASTNSHRDQDIRRVLFRLAALAEETGVAVLVVRHLNKSSGGPAIYRGGGSIGIIGAARSGLLVARDPEDEDRRILASTKSNLGPPSASLIFHLEAEQSGAARVVWDGTSAHGADVLLAAPSTDEDRAALDEAKDFLATMLGSGPVASKQILKDARAAGISDITLRRAKGAVGVVSRKEGMCGGWVWMLPEGDHAQSKVLTPGDRASSVGDEHLRGPEVQAAPSQVSTEPLWETAL